MMKKYFYSLLFVGIALQSHAQVEFTTNYAYSRPMGQMLTNIKGIHGLNMGLAYHIPHTPVAVGVEVGFGGYGYQSERQTYTFTDGSTTETNVNVSNNTFNLMLNTRLYYPTESIFRPYLQLRGGLSNFYTSLVIEDPEDVDGCRPLESDILKSSATLAGGAGIGMRINLGGSGCTKYAVDISSNYTTGGRVDYMNLKKATPTVKPVADVNADFMNLHNQVVHTHHVGYVYSSPLRLLDLRVGLSVVF
jgi:Outer membrane protein beta-barrel domain